MELSQFKKALAGLAVAAVSLTQAGTVFAAYSDVPAGVWYEEAVSSFTDAGYLDATQTRFRGGDAANRAEFVKLVVELNGGILSTPPTVASFNDVATSAWYFGYFEEAAKEGWVRGDNNCYGKSPCNARPGANINRAEAASLIVRAFGLESSDAAPQFVDNASGQWYTNDVQTAADACILQGDDSTGRVRPGDNMNRAEMVAMLYRADQGLAYGADCGDSVTPAAPMIKAVTATDSKTLEVEFNTALDADTATDASMYTVTGDATLVVTAAEAIEADVVRLTLATTTVAGNSYTLTATDMLTSEGVKFTDTMDFSGYTNVAPSNASLEVSLASANPVADTLPKGALGVAMLSVDLTASCEDEVVLDHLTVLHEGFGDESDIEGLYASVDGSRLSRKRTIKNEDQTADIRFSKPLVIGKCKTVTVDILADFKTNAATSGQHNLVLELASDVQSNAKSVTGSFPLRGQSFTVAAVSTGTITVAYRTVTPSQIEVGDTAATIGKFQLTASSVQDESIYTLTLENNGSASDGDFTNIAVRRSDNTVLTNTVASSAGDFVTLVFDPPFTILEGDKVTLEVVADITGGANNTIQMALEEDSDLFSVGSLYGYGLNGQLYGSQVTRTGSADTVSIDAGEFTVSLNGPAANTYTKDTDSAVLANLTFKAGQEDADVQQFFLLVEGQDVSSTALTYSPTTVMDNLKIRNVATGQSVDGNPVSGALSTGRQIYRFDDFVVRGEQEFEVQVDFMESGANPASGDKFKVHVCATAATVNCNFGGLASGDFDMQVEGISTGDVISDVRPGATITGNFHDIATSSLSIALESINAADTSVRNAKNVTLTRFSARAGDAEDILFTTIGLSGTASTLLTNANNYTLWVDTDSDGTVDKIVETGVTSQNNTITFDTFAGGGILLAKEKNVFFEVHADIASSLASSSLQLTIPTASTAVIEAEQADNGSSLTGIKVNGVGAATDEILLTTAGGQTTLFTLAQQGDLYVTKDSTPTRTRQLLGGTTSDDVLRLNFRAQNEKVKVKDLRFTVTGSASAVSSLALYLDGATTSFGSATTNACGAFAAAGVFCFSTNDPKLVIPEGSDVDVVVKAMVKADTAGGTSGGTVTVTLATTNSVEADGYESSNPLTVNDGDSTAEGEVFVGTNTAAANAVITGNTNNVVMAKILTITNINPASDNTAVPTGITPAGQFRFTAASNLNAQNGTNKAIIKDLVFNVTANAVTTTTGSYKLYNKADSNISFTCNNSAVTGTITVTCPTITGVNTQIDAGQNLDLVLEFDVASVSANATLQVSLRDFSKSAETTFGVANSHIRWYDNDSTVNVAQYYVESAETVVNSTTYKSN